MKRIILGSIAIAFYSLLLWWGMDQLGTYVGLNVYTTSYHDFFWGALSGAGAALLWWQQSETKE